MSQFIWGRLLPSTAEMLEEFLATVELYSFQNAITIGENFDFYEVYDHRVFFLTDIRERIGWAEFKHLRHPAGDTVKVEIWAEDGHEHAVMVKWDLLIDAWKEYCILLENRDDQLPIQIVENKKTNENIKLTIPMRLRFIFFGYLEELGDKVTEDVIELRLSDSIWHICMMAGDDERKFVKLATKVMKEFDQNIPLNANNLPGFVGDTAAKNLYNYYWKYKKNFSEEKWKKLIYETAREI